MNKSMFAFVCLLAATAAAGEPFGWRGDGSGRFASADPPTAWSKETNVVWKAAIPHGYNSPVYADGRLFITGEPALVLAFDARTGKELWRQSASYEEALGKEKAAEIKRTHEQFDAEKRKLREPFEAQRKTDPKAPESEELKQQTAAIDKRHDEYEKQFPLGQRGSAGNTAATPITDGEAVYAVFNTGIVAAFSTDGKQSWVKHIEAPPLNFGQSASPVMADGKLIVHLQHLIALDPKTGEEAWRASVPPKHGSPVVAKIDECDIIVTPSGALVRASDGELLAEKLFDLSDNSPLVHDGMIYAHQSGSVKALKLPASIGDRLEVEELWETPVKGEQRMTSATFHNGVVYAGNRRGILDAIDAETGKLLYQKRLQVGELFPSVAFAGDRVYLFGTEGKAVVLEPGSKYRELDKGELEHLSSSPIFIGNRMFVRTDKTLYCIGETEAFVSKP